jgi:hypothetical protein
LRGEPLNDYLRAPKEEEDNALIWFDLLHWLWWL